MKALELEGKVDEYTPLLPDDVLRDVITVLNGELEVPTSEDQAKRLLQVLLAGYPDLNPHDRHGYVTKVKLALMDYPLGVSMAVTATFPKTHGFHPREAELRGALKAEKDRVLIDVGLARMQLIERTRRADAQAEEAKLVKSPEAKERARKAAEAVLTSLRTMEDPHARR